MILYIENPKDPTRKLLELINDYSKVEGYKINTQKYLAFLYGNNKKIETEIKETSPFTIVKKIIKYLGVYLPKEIKDLYIENYKTLVNEIKEDTNRWINISCSWIRRINIVIMSILPKAIYKLNAAAAKSLQSCLTLCDPIDSSPPGSPIPWILQARTLERVAISFSNG